jgi:predicted acetyltransferase
VLGTARLRHRLNESLRNAGGHIGYDIRPSERRKGYGNAILAMVLPRARELGLRRVLLTCAADNVASARIIERNGGVLESRGRLPDGRELLRYWIDL